MRKLVAPFVVLLVGLSLFLAGSARADTYEEDPTVTGQSVINPAAYSFGLVCNLPSPSVNARARVDVRNFAFSTNRDYIVADDGWYRSLTQSTNAQASWQPDLVRLDLLIQRSNGTQYWSAWQNEGHVLNDGVTVPSSYHWPPNTFIASGEVIVGIRMRAWSQSGTTCTSPGLYWPAP